MPTTNPMELSRFIRALAVLREETGNTEIQAQTMMILAYVAYRHPNEVPFQEAEKVLGLTQTSTSRNAKYLSDGLKRPNQTNPKKTDKVGGYGLVTVKEDPYYVKRKLLTLTAEGLRIASLVGRVLAGETK